MHDIISQLKEMQHYSQSNIERLSAIWLHISDDLKQEDFTAKASELLTVQNAFQDQVTAFISDYEMARNKIEQEAS